MGSATSKAIADKLCDGCCCCSTTAQTPTPSRPPAFWYHLTPLLCFVAGGGCCCCCCCLNKFKQLRFVEQQTKPQAYIKLTILSPLPFVQLYPFPKSDPWKPKNRTTSPCIAASPLPPLCMSFCHRPCRFRHCLTFELKASSGSPKTLFQLGFL